MKYIEVKGLKVSVEGMQIVKGVDLAVDKGEVVALMGPNGSGKSSLAFAIMGHPKYLAEGKILVDGKDVIKAPADERSKLGLFLSFQNPVEIPGVSISSFLRASLNSRLEMPINVADFRKLLKEKMLMLKIDEGFADRYLEGFSGGEKKKLEILQMLVLNPKIAILDETDSGLDIDALKIVANGIREAIKNGTGVLVITHYKRLLEYLKPDRVYVMLGGKIVRHDGVELVEQLEREGYDWINRD